MHTRVNTQEEDVCTHTCKHAGGRCMHTHVNTQEEDVHTPAHTCIYCCICLPIYRGIYSMELAQEVVGAGQTGLQSEGGTFSSGTSLFSS